MTEERFLTLLDIHGADWRRWPRDERDAARAMASLASPSLQKQIADASLLDGLLDAHQVAPPDAALVQRVIGGAPAQGRTRAPLSWLWPGAGLAGIGLAGTFAGAFTVSLVLRATQPPPGADWAERGTAFTELSADWSEE